MLKNVIQSDPASVRLVELEVRSNAGGCDQRAESGAWGNVAINPAYARLAGVVGCSAALSNSSSNSLLKLCTRFLYGCSAAVLLIGVVGFFGIRGDSAPVIVGHHLREAFTPSSVNTGRLELLERLTAEQKREMARQVHFISEVIKQTNSRLPNPDGVARAIVRQSRLANYDPFFVAAVIKSESTFRNYAVSNKGAVGLMQLMPDTARYISNKTKSDWLGHSQLADPEHNIRLGIAYLKYLERYFGGNRERVLIAYNWGPANMIEAMKGTKPVLSASRKYARTIMSNHQSWQNDFQMRLAQYRYMNLDHLVG